MELWSSSQASWTLLYGLQLSQLLMLLRKDGEGRQEQAQALCRGLGAGRTREGTTSPLPGSTELAGGMFSCFTLTPESVGCKKAVFPQSCQAGDWGRRAESSWPGNGGEELNE